MFIRSWFNKNKHRNKQPQQQNRPVIPISANLEDTITKIINQLGNSPDVIVRRFTLGKEKRIPAALLYTDGLVSNSIVNHFFQTLLTEYPEHSNLSPRTVVKDQLLNVGEVIESENQTKIINELLRGASVILIEGEKKALIANSKGWESRGVTEPENQVVIRGPREGFTENIRTNTALIRRKIPSSKLRLEQMRIGTLTETTVGIMYIEGNANPKIVEEVRNRLSKIKIDSVLESGYLEEFIQDAKWSLFPTIFNTERPDIAAAELLEGKIVILVDGTPFVLVVPATIVRFFDAADDYYIRAPMASLLRLLRIATFMLSMILPSLYVAVTTFHQELLPTTLLISIAAQREGIPFPAFVEALMMELTFEVLREAGIRMPRAVGQAVSIVGALVLGTAAVEAGIISAAMVIIVSMTAIAGFTAPSVDLAIAARIIRFGLLVLSASFGLFGILFGLMMIAIHLVGLRSFGIPYLNGLAPFNLSDQKDIFMRIPWFMMLSRPRLFSQANEVREKPTIPHPPKSRRRNKQEGDPS
ncbi:spore germination protein [Tepidibacillus sp. LV47]|uniref:spore germination protein n=1 Tax=Tepidibacillus sp. LV47 TaxID=3398228 RepID=UPI003AACFD27